MEIVYEGNKKMPINDVLFGSVIKIEEDYYIVVDKWMENKKTVVVNLDDGSYAYINEGQRVELVEKVKLVLG